MSTVIEKILKKKGKIQGNVAIVNVDKIMSHDTTTPLAIEAFEKLNSKEIQKEKIIIVFDQSWSAAFNKQHRPSFVVRFMYFIKLIVGIDDRINS